MATLGRNDKQERIVAYAKALLEPKKDPVGEKTMATLVDDRTEAQKKTHPVIVMMTDRMLSGWGGAEGGLSYAGWACKLEDEYRVERWVRSRRDAMRVRFVGAGYRPGAYCAHCHIYVVTKGHAALN